MSTFASRQCRQSSVSRLVVLVRPPLCCSVLQCGVAVYCSVFQSTIASVTTLVNRPCRSLSAWQPVILGRPHLRCTVLQCVHTRGCSVFAVCRGVLQCVAMHGVVCRLLRADRAARCRVTAGDFGASPFLLQYVAVWCCRGLQVVAVCCCSVV